MFEYSIGETLVLFFRIGDVDLPTLMSSKKKSTYMLFKSLKRGKEIVRRQGQLYVLIATCSRSQLFKDSLAWNIMIHGLVQESKYMEAWQLFRKTQLCYLKASNDTMAILLLASFLPYCLCLGKMAVYVY